MLYDAFGLGVKAFFRYKVEAYAEGGVLESIRQVGNSDYNLEFPSKSKPVYIDEALYFNQIYTKDTLNSYTLNFGANGSLNATNTIGNDGQEGSSEGGNIKFTQYATVTINVTVSEEQLRSVHNGDIYTRTLISSYGTGNGMWNVLDNLTVNVVGLEGYMYVGKLENDTKVNNLEAGQWGYVTKGGDSVGIAFVKHIPEPGTITFSLLALVGFAARKRRK